MIQEKKMKEYRFQAVIETAGGGGAFVVIPFDVEEAFGKKRVPVAATIDGVPYRGTLVRYGRPEHLLVVLKEIRSQIGKGPGDSVEVMVREDVEERTVDIPAELEEALRGSPTARERFEALAFSHRREHAAYVAAAKKEETRKRRAENTLRTLLGEKD